MQIVKLLNILMKRTYNIIEFRYRKGTKNILILSKQKNPRLTCSHSNIFRQNNIHWDHSQYQKGRNIFNKQHSIFIHVISIYILKYSSCSTKQIAFKYGIIKLDRIIRKGFAERGKLAEKKHLYESTSFPKPNIIWV
jgi:hypothetical protein